VFTLVHSEVLQTIVVSRHCDRTPISYTQQIPLNPINWKQQLGLSSGQLTGLGISQVCVLYILFFHCIIHTQCIDISSVNSWVLDYVRDI
jgi:hypothetical protein